jgi:hypothetical protein
VKLFCAHLVFKNSTSGKALLNDVSVTRVPGGKFKFKDFDKGTPLGLIANEAFPLCHNLMRP